MTDNSNIVLSQEQIVKLQEFMDSFKKDPTVYEFVRSFFVKDQGEPTLEGLLQYAERYIRTQHGMTGGSWNADNSLLELTLNARVKQEKRTT